MVVEGLSILAIGTVGGSMFFWRRNRTNKTHSENEETAKAAPELPQTLYDRMCRLFGAASSRDRLNDIAQTDETKKLVVLFGDDGKPHVVDPKNPRLVFSQFSDSSEKCRGLDTDDMTERDLLGADAVDLPSTGPRAR
ncbi:MAG: hypothetical protein CMF48_06985 [Legionellales bacterium]|nr:hypothetical protein [Legionellales bacterium]|tara:strand:+ start:547 stop:960 length:414 start_codon:yes stop_codon:yes gene_type:complete